MQKSFSFLEEDNSPAVLSYARYQSLQNELKNTLEAILRKNQTLEETSLQNVPENFEETFNTFQAAAITFYKKAVKAIQLSSGLVIEEGEAGPGLRIKKTAHVAKVARFQKALEENQTHLVSLQEQERQVEKTHQTLLTTLTQEEATLKANHKATDESLL